jgi:hypothetical protein
LIETNSTNKWLNFVPILSSGKPRLRTITSIVEQTEEVLARARAFDQPLIYKTHGEVAAADADGDEISIDELIDVIAGALAEKSIEYRRMLDDAVKPLQREIAALRERIAGLETHRAGPTIERPRLVGPAS